MYRANFDAGNDQRNFTRVSLGFSEQLQTIDIPSDCGINRSRSGAAVRRLADYFFWGELTKLSRLRCCDGRDDRRVKFSFRYC